MTKTWSRFLLLAAVLLPLVSCSDTDPFDIPDDMVALNMMNEDHGKTLMGKTDIFINRDMNFVSEAYQFIEVHKARDLGHVEEEEPELNTLTDKAAVEQYAGILAVRTEDVVRFPSGRLAIRIDRPYYRVWVDDFIYEDEDEKHKVGAIVNFAQYMPVPGGLPKAYTEMGAVSESAPLLVALSAKECEGLIPEPYSKYFECKVTNQGHTYTDIQVSLRPGALAAMPAEMKSQTFPLFVRTSRSCTVLNFQVK